MLPTFTTMGQLRDALAVCHTEEQRHLLLAAWAQNTNTADLQPDPSLSRQILDILPLIRDNADRITIPRSAGAMLGKRIKETLGKFLKHAEAVEDACRLPGSTKNKAGIIGAARDALLGTWKDLIGFDAHVDPLLLPDNKFGHSTWQMLVDYDSAVDLLGQVIGLMIQFKMAHMPVRNLDERTLNSVRACTLASRVPRRIPRFTDTVKPDCSRPGCPTAAAQPPTNQPPAGGIFRRRGNKK